MSNLLNDIIADATKWGDSQRDNESLLVIYKKADPSIVRYDIPRLVFVGATLPVIMKDMAETWTKGKDDATLRQIIGEFSKGVADGNNPLLEMISVNDITKLPKGKQGNEALAYNIVRGIYQAALDKVFSGDEEDKSSSPDKMLVAFYRKPKNIPLVEVEYHLGEQVSNLLGTDDIAWYLMDSKHAKSIRYRDVFTARKVLGDLDTVPSLVEQRDNGVKETLKHIVTMEAQFDRIPDIDDDDVEWYEEYSDTPEMNAIFSVLGEQLSKLRAKAKKEMRELDAAIESVLRHVNKEYTFLVSQED